MSDPSITDLYQLQCSALPSDARVAGFVAEEGLSRLYRLSVGVLTNGGSIDLAQARGLVANLVVNTGGDEPFAFHGMVAEASLRHAWEGQALFELVIVPKVWVLTLTHFCRVFVDRTVPEIIETILEDGGLGSDDYELRLQESYEPHFHTCQYKESRWAFLSRLMEREGLYYFFEHGDGGDKLIITDHRSFHQPLRQSAVRYVPLSGGDDAMSVEALSVFTSRSRSLPRSVKLRDFDYLKPGLDVSTEETVWDESSAKQLHLGEHDFRTPEGGKSKARALAEAFKARELTYQGRGRVFGLRAGYRFTLDEHPLDAINREYLAVALHHQGVQAAESGLVRELLGITTTEDYRVEVDAIDSAVQWRCPKRTPVPRISSVERGFVDGPADSEYAQIDEHGRYKVKLHFDVDDNDLWDGEASTWIRMLQPHGGSTEGFHFPLRKKTEVLVLFLGGDPDRPVIAGAVPNATNPSPVTSKNHTQNAIVTGANNRLVFEDQQDQEWIELSTPNNNTFIYFGHPRVHIPGPAFSSSGTAGAGAPAANAAPADAPSVELPATHITNTLGTKVVDVGENWVGYVHGFQREEVTGLVYELFNAGHTTRVSGTRKLVVDGPQVINVTGNEDRTVDGWWNNTSNSGTTHTSPTWTNTIDGHTLFKSGTAQLNFGTTDLYFGSTTAVWGDTNVDIASMSGKIGSLDLKIPGGATITTPKWDVKNPEQTWQSAKWDLMGTNVTWTASKGIEMTGIAIAVSGIKAETYALAMTLHGFKRENKGVNLNNFGSDVRTKGLMSALSGLWSMA